MSANAGTGVLDPCVCRVSVRKVQYDATAFRISDVRLSVQLQSVVDPGCDALHADDTVRVTREAGYFMQKTKAIVHVCVKRTRRESGASHRC